MIFGPLLVTAPSDWNVVPGQRIGHIEIDRPVPKGLPKPDGEDGAMGKYQTTWRGKGGGRLDVFATSRGDGPGVDVRVAVAYATSPRFHLANGLHPGSSVQAMRRAFPGAKRVVPNLPGGAWPSLPGKGTPWNDLRHGIGWTVAPNGTVGGILVYRPRLRPRP